MKNGSQSEHFIRNYTVNKMETKDRFAHNCIKWEYAHARKVIGDLKDSGNGILEIIIPRRREDIGAYCIFSSIPITMAPSIAGGHCVRFMDHS